LYFRLTASICCCLPCIAAAAAGYIAKGIFNGLSTSISHTATYLTMKEIRQRLIAKLTRMPMGTILESPSGYYKDVIVDRVEGIEVPLAHLLPEMTANVLAPVLMLIYLFTLDWRLALLSLITIPVGMAVMSTTMKSYGENYGKSVEIGGRMTNAIVEYMGGIEVIKAFSQGERSYEKYETAVNDNAAFFYGWMKSAQWAMSAYNAITPSVLLTVLPFGFLFYSSGSLSAGAFVTMIILSLGLLEPLIAAMNYTDNIARVGTVMGQINDVLNSGEISRTDKNPNIAGNTIEFRNVTFSYDSENDALRNISLTIPEGKVTALVGHSGSGKSTVAKLIAGFWDVSEGELMIGGQNVRDIPLEVQTGRIAYVEQNNFLFDETVMENIRKPYIITCRMSGCSELRIIMRHILPNIVPHLLVLYSTGLSGVIIMISSYAFLGLGLEAGAAEWGAMLVGANKLVFSHPELIVYPGLCIVFAAAGFNLFGEALRDICDPKEG
ncbi:MAG: ATP-binding cassette domain-containing protein, partial [Oscillospiraceae bacterium]|nr:ATP-binding cassette domain-containing protein [Oscillospiraceae bacterium]